MSAASRSVHLSDPVLSQDVLVADLAGSIAGHPSDRLLKTLAWLFTAHVNDRLEPGYTWIPRYGALIGPYGRRTGPTLEEMERLIHQSFEDFLLLMPGSNRWAGPVPPEGQTTAAGRRGSRHHDR